jgi:uncharacterized membrane protein
MKQITATFFKGLFTLLPLMLSIYVFIWFLTGVENFSRQAITIVWPDNWYIPGMGVIFCFAVIYAFGTVVDRPLARWIFSFIESLFREMPIIKTVYVALKDFTEYLKPGKAKNNQVVLVRWPGSQIEMVGLMTREHLRDLPPAVTKEGKVAVYFPMSYQFGGCTLFIPREWVHPTNLSVEAAMRSIITAWLPGEDKKLEQV